MKAKIKATGEIIEVEEYPYISFTVNQCFYRQMYSMSFYKIDELEILDNHNFRPQIINANNPIDWEQRRYEIAKDVLITLIPMCANVSRETKDNTIQTNVGFSFEGFSKGAVNLADALIAELKKK